MSRFNETIAEVFLSVRSVLPPGFWKRGRTAGGWTDPAGGGGPVGDARLLETGDFRLLENGDNRLLE